MKIIRRFCRKLNAVKCHFLLSASLCCLVTFWYFELKEFLIYNYRDFVWRNDAYDVKEKLIRNFFASDPNAFSEVKHFLEASGVFREKLILVDWKDDKTGSNNCTFCKEERRQIITFVLLSPFKGPLENRILRPLLEAWNSYSAETIIVLRRRNFTPTDLPIGIFLKNGGIIFEIILLHRKDNYWWHGSFDQDAEYKSKLSKFELLDFKKNLALNHEGTFHYFQLKPLVLDGIKIIMAENITYFDTFIECNYEQANKFYSIYPQDRADGFKNKVRKILANAKVALDDLGIPFWLDSGTLLGFYRQCDVISYTSDVDIGIFIWDFNDGIIKAFLDRGFKLKHIFGKVSEGYELSFLMDGEKLDVFFYYDGGDHFWYGTYRKDWLTRVFKYRNKYPTFNLCWTEFLGMEIRIPCETEQMLKTSYGSEWFKPIESWHWVKSPKNVEWTGVWPRRDTKEVYQVL